MENRFVRLSIKDVLVFKPRIFEDERGYFFENFNYCDFYKFSGKKFKIIQENISLSKKNVVRGLHFQKGQYAQSKLISVLNGKIIDVVVDIRPRSKTFGQWISYMLTAKNNESLFVPAGFAHGFLSLADYTRISYKVDKPYKRDYECCLLWNDKSVNISWPIANPLISDKDLKGKKFTHLIPSLI